MTCAALKRPGAALAVLLLAVVPAAAHITPPVVLVSDRDALVALLAGARRFFVREVRLSGEDRRTIHRRTGWSPDEDFYRFYLGRDAEGRLVAASIFVTDFTVHGPVRVAVGLAPDGRVKGATVVEVTEETYQWVKPLIDRNFTADLAAAGRPPAAETPAGLDPMAQFYAGVIAGLVRRAAVLFEVGVLGHGGAA
jgi:hypothetical protein